MKKIILSALCVMQLYGAASDEVRHRRLTCMEKKQFEIVEGICTIDSEQKVQPTVHLFPTKRLKKRKHRAGKKSIVVPALAVVWLRIQDRSSLQLCPSTTQQEAQDHLTTVLKTTCKSDQLRHGIKDKQVLELLKKYAIKDDIPIEKRLKARLKELHIILLLGNMMFEAYKRYDTAVVSGQYTRGVLVNEMISQGDVQVGAPKIYGERLPIVLIDLNKWRDHIQEA